MSASTFARPMRILLVEDNAGDVRLTQEALREAGACYELYVVRDGAQALAFLRQQGQYQEALRPDLVLLDLNMPGKDGRQTLAEIKSDDTLKDIPVVVLTVSTAPEDVRRAYLNHANSYITKPTDMDDFIDAMRSLGDFWFSIARLPSD